ncbi:MAG: OFA family MFS transporter [Oscillospiraceae bacterium]|nr:OFA family MFS transporter [Oscillospiraceae bacterium]
MDATKQRGLSAVLAAIAIQLIIGVAYIWSVFQTGVANSIFGGDNAAASLTFSILLATLTVGSVFGGKLAIRFSTRRVVFIGGLILSAGFFLASLVTEGSGWLLWITYGAMGGVGMGFTYSTTIACAQKWYPHKKGFVTGVIVAALGFGGVVFTPIVEKLVDVFGGPGTADGLGGEPKTFVVLSAVFLVVCSAGSVFLINPPEGYAVGGAQSKAVRVKATRDYTALEMLKTPRFYIVTAAFMMAVMGGLMMIGFAKPIAVAKDLESTATIGVLAISMFNSVGRFFWGMASDRLGRKNTIIILLAASAVLSLVVNFIDGVFIYVVIGAIGFFYGGLLSTFPSLTADLFGAKNMAANYGFVLLGFGAGAIISSQIAGHYRNIAAVADDIGKMFPAFLIASCCAAGGILMMLALKYLNKRDKMS